MKVLEERVYADDVEDRRRLLPYGLHPGKMNLALTRDCIIRYTRPGDTIIDPFMGIGGTGMALLEGRHVLGIELEPHHAQNAARNLRHLERIAHDLGREPWWEVVCGDSQQVLQEARDRIPSALTSPAFGEMNAEHAGGNVTQRPNKDGVGFEGGKEFFTYNRDAAASVNSPPYQDARSGWNIAEGQENIRYAPPGHPGSGLMSPPYADALSETPESAARQAERVAEKIARGDRHPEGTKWGRRGSWGGGNAHRVTQGYEGAALSPPYDDMLKRNRSQEPYAQKHPELSREYGRTDPARSADGYGKASQQIGNMRLKDGSYQAACTAVYAGLYGAIRDGGVMVVVTGNYVRKDPETDKSEVIDLAQITIELARNAGWTPWERWVARKKRIGFWRIYWAKKGQPRIDSEDVLCFVKGPEPGWSYTELPPTGVTDDPVPTQLF